MIPRLDPTGDLVRRRPGDAQGVALLLLAAALALGTALPGLGSRGVPFAEPSRSAETGSWLPQVRRADPSARIGIPPPRERSGLPGSKPGLPVPVDINRASVEALQALPGIGPTLAERIVADRATRGPFQDPEDLLRVSGIGARRLARVRSLIRATEWP